MKRSESMEQIDSKILRGQLDLIVLNELAKEPLHGYGVISSLRKTHRVYYGPSTIYPMLNAMEEVGLVESKWDLEHDRPRKVYTITKNGENVLDAAVPYAWRILSRVAKDYMNRHKVDKIPLSTDLQDLETPEKSK